LRQNGTFCAIFGGFMWSAHRRNASLAFAAMQQKREIRAKSKSRLEAPEFVNQEIVYANHCSSLRCRSTAKPLHLQSDHAQMHERADRLPRGDG
jgi:hypothetical protein